MLRALDKQTAVPLVERDGLTGALVSSVNAENAARLTTAPEARSILFTRGSRSRRSGCVPQTRSPSESAEAACPCGWSPETRAGGSCDETAGAVVRMATWSRGGHRARESYVAEAFPRQPASQVEGDQRNRPVTSGRES